MSGCRVIGLGDAGKRLRTQIVRSRTLPSALEPAVDARWHTMRSGNPRLYDGRTLAYLGFDEVETAITACVAPYRYLAVRPHVPTGVVQLGVTGVLTRGEGQERCVLVARRGRDTLLYPGRWELAPSGGIDAPPDDVGELSLDDLREQLRREVREELGLAIAPADAAPLALCHDPVAPSVDIVLALHVGSEPEVCAMNWEYDDLLWLPLRERPLAIASLDLIEPSRAVLGILCDF